MTVLVIDSSVAVAWLLEDENEPRAIIALDAVNEEGGFVPAIWHAEVRNAMLTAERSGRVSDDKIANISRIIEELPIDTDSQPDFDAAMDLARKHRLSFYDAVFLELAKRLSAQLATLDRALARAARSEGVPLTV